MIKIKERVIRVVCNMAWRLEESVDHLRAELVSNYDRNNFFVRNFTRVVFATEWVLVKIRIRLEPVERNEMFKGCDFLEDCKHLEEMDSFENKI